jgi:hypothetical protein
MMTEFITRNDLRRAFCRSGTRVPDALCDRILIPEWRPHSSLSPTPLDPKKETSSAAGTGRDAYGRALGFVALQYATLIIYALPPNPTFALVIVARLFFCCPVYLDLLALSISFYFELPVFMDPTHSGGLSLNFLKWACNNSHTYTSRAWRVHGSTRTT